MCVIFVKYWCFLEEEIKNEGTADPWPFHQVYGYTLIPKDLKLVVEYIWQLKDINTDVLNPQRGL